MPETTARVADIADGAGAGLRLQAAQAADAGDQDREDERLDQPARKSVTSTTLSTSCRNVTIGM